MSAGVPHMAALIEDTKVARDDFVLISAASSSVGLKAIQLANYGGATTIALTSAYCREPLPLRGRWSCLWFGIAETTRFHPEASKERYRCRFRRQYAT
jgi:hypothetical protein